MTINVTLTFPETIIRKIDKDRADVNRSRYVLRLIEEAYSHNQCSTRINIRKQSRQLSEAIRVGRSTQPQIVATDDKTTPEQSDSSHDK